MNPRLTDKLAKMLAYVLGRRPDEFGLVPDAEGFVSVKELLKALGEEADFRRVRRGDIEEILLTGEAPFELQETRIRAGFRGHLTPDAPAETLPKLLYAGIRRKAYAGVLEKGISPSGRPYVVLSPAREMAERMGQRSDSDPVILTVLVEKCRENGVRFLSSGELLFLAEHIPARCFTGPPLPKEKESPSREKASAEMKTPKLPGSYFPDPTDLGLLAGKKRDRRGTRPDWKKGRKQMIRTGKKKGLPF